MELNNNEIQTQVETSSQQGAGSAETGAEGTGETQVSTGESTGAGEGTSTDSGDKGSITIDEAGNFTIADSVLDSQLAEIGRQPIKTIQDAETKLSDTQSEQVPANAYTPEELAKAFLENKVESGRIPTEAMAYYKAILAEQQRSQAVIDIDRNAEIQKFIQRPIQLPQPPQPPRQTALTPTEFAQLQAAGKTLASRYLNIAEADFDEFNAQHTAALATAVNDIRTRANEIRMAQAQQSQVQYQQQVQLYQQQQQLIRAQQLNTITTEFKKIPNWEDIDKNFYPKWRESLDANAGAAVDKILAEGNVDNVKAVLRVVVDAYNAGKKPMTQTKQSADPPVVMQASGVPEPKEQKGFVDASKLGEMTREEQAAWFIANKFV